MLSSISMAEFYQKQNKQPLKVVDVREKHEFNQGHIDQAINLPLTHLAQAKKQLSKQETYYVICHSGGRSMLACQLLSGAGYQVVNVMGGMSAWPSQIVQD
ncbi:rhodanese-like domain-containing protein [Vaginisenegalia massiliensis]|uniref:rhodanese-like domain-containing protein n=1 Tax=Vaginisenegalia massiliensis TaxID=2058294 RepID=UPI000F525D62|nr:rhodanese-like domain-containing protein [Vaginisenegalia massiliensis]